MIEYNSKAWFRHLIQFPKSDTLRILFVEMLIVGVYTGVVTYVDNQFVRGFGETGSEVRTALKNTTIMHSILGFVLSLLLAFRVNSAYDRWWEGRKLWGALVNHTRNLAIKINAWLPPENRDDRTFFRLMIPNFVFGLKEHLRSGVELEQWEDCEAIKERVSGKEHQLNLLVQEVYRRIKSLVSTGQISPEEQIVIDKELKSLTDIMGGCERIRNTPIPFSYNMFLKKFIFFYIVTLPIGFAAYFQYWAIPISMFVFYVLVSLEIIAEEIEDPFGKDPNDLPTDKLAGMIRRNVDEIFAAESQVSG